MIFLLFPVLFTLAGWWVAFRSSEPLGRRLWLVSSLAMAAWLWSYTDLPALTDPDARRLWFVLLLLGLELVRTALPAARPASERRLAALSSFQALGIVITMIVVPLPAYAIAPLVWLTIFLLPIGARIYKSLPAGGVFLRLALSGSFSLGFAAALFPFIDRNWLPANAFVSALGCLLFLLACLAQHTHQRPEAPSSDPTVWRQLGILLFLAGSVPHFLQFA